ncbi:HAD family hydrolase [Trichococcus shcherbakoviae]|uniref:HAD family hydrolase n=1 Tax=Trichococcus shcherbakoviae subsp. psychrophilus TaxID=2585775 RepID=A0A5C5E732_9LACT|nr:HAD family hydrolase [Trichococcus shcherbakoviae]TNV68318.1 HAD family hydrolase [Trichococcus shcherbakoviae subsp. psychrophilus]
MVKTFIFDVDDTLYDQLEPFRRAFQKHFSQFENEVKIEELYKLSRKYSDEAFETTGYEITNMRKMHIYRISKAFEELGIRISDEEALQFQLDYEAFQNEIKLIEEIPQIFELLLQRGAKIGIITNGANDNQLRKIKQLGLEKWIAPENMLISEGAGVSKPSKEIFEAMERRMGFAKNDVYYIGDNFDNDVIGATAAGWKTIWVNFRNHKTIGQEVSATYVVESPQELLRLVDVLTIAL